MGQKVSSFLGNAAALVVSRHVGHFELETVVIVGGYASVQHEMR